MELDTRFIKLINQEAEPQTIMSPNDQLENDVSEIKKLIGSIKLATEQLDINVNGKNGFKVEVNFKMHQTKKQAILKLISTTQTTINQIKTKLDAMAENNKVLGQTGLGTMASNFHRFLTQQFVEAVTAFNMQYVAFHSYIDQTLERQIKIIHPTATKQEISEIKTTTAFDTTPIFSQVLISPEHSQARERLRSYIELNRDVLQLEGHIADLKQLFIEANVLICQQGTIIDSISSHVSQATNYVDRGNKELNQAVTRSRGCTIF